MDTARRDGRSGLDDDRAGDNEAHPQQTRVPAADDRKGTERSAAAAEHSPRGGSIAVDGEGDRRRQHEAQCSARSSQQIRTGRAVDRCHRRRPRSAARMPTPTCTTARRTHRLCTARSLQVPERTRQSRTCGEQSAAQQPRQPAEVARRRARDGDPHVVMGERREPQGEQQRPPDSLQVAWRAEPPSRRKRPHTSTPRTDTTSHRNGPNGHCPHGSTATIVPTIDSGTATGGCTS